ncbi:hypothetical protein ABBQ32_009233 [Trebouxia sp. C0010 RCD-2024]
MRRQPAGELAAYKQHISQKKESQEAAAQPSAGGVPLYTPADMPAALVNQQCGAAMRLQRPLAEKEATDGADLLQQLTRVLTGQKDDHWEPEAHQRGTGDAPACAAPPRDAPPSWGGGCQGWTLSP